MPDGGYRLAYKPDGEILRQFLLSTAFVRLIRGPIGSGKSVSCCIDLFLRACAQEPSKDGRRRTRWAIIRNTYPELHTTTIKTWLEWFPEHVFGNMRKSAPITHHIVWPLADKTVVDAEFIFLALDSDEDIKKLLSLELTGGWINEAREVPKSIIDAATSRMPRFPPAKDGVRATRPGLVCDTNAPDEDHWWPIMAGNVPPPDWMTNEERLTLVKPEDWKFFEQPAAMLRVKGPGGETIGYELNEGHENRKNLDAEYYRRVIQGKAPNWIKVYVLNELGTLMDGQPVYHNFDGGQHVAREPLAFLPGLPLWVGVDFGLTPAAIFGQRMPDGRWLALSELVPGTMGAQRFAAACKIHLSNFYPTAKKVFAYGDPSGDNRAQTNEETPFMIMRRGGFTVLPAPSNDLQLRIDAVDSTLTRMVNGRPGLLVDPAMRMIIRGFEAGYHYRRLKVPGQQKYELEPNKNRYSHPHDALQYKMLGAGEGRKLTIGDTPARPHVARTAFNPFDRQKALKRANRSPFDRRTGG